MTMWSEEQEAYLIEKVRKGVPVLQIARKLKKTRTACYHKCYVLGLSKTKRVHPVYSDEKKIDEILKLYNEGYHVKKIGPMVGLTVDLVRNVLKRKNVKPRKKFTLKGAKTYDPALVEDIRRMFLDEKMTQKAIGDTLGLRYTMVRDICLSRGFRRANEWTTEEYALMEKLLTEGLSLEETSKRLGRSVSAIANKGYGIPHLRKLESFNMWFNEYAAKSKSLRAVLASRVKSAQRSVLTRGLPCDIDLEYLKELFIAQAGRCFYTDELMTSIASKPNCVSIDRVDSSKGYVRGNVVLCCWIVNKMKQNLILSDFLEVCLKLAGRKEIIATKALPEKELPASSLTSFDFSKPLP